MPSPEDLYLQSWTALTAGAPVEAPAVQWRGGDEGALPSRLRVADTAAACIATALAAGAALQRERGQSEPTVGLDMGHVAAAVRSERYFKSGGEPAGMGFAPLSRFWRAADGWVRTHANYPWHRRALLEALGADGDEDDVSSALAILPAQQVEEAVFNAGGVAGAVRTAEGWAGHPQGQAVAAEPLISHRREGEAAPRARPGQGLPASGVRVLDLTRVIAGPVCTRFLGALGADVLRVDPPGHPDLQVNAVADTLLGKRSTGLDLSTAQGRQMIEELLGSADVVVVGYRPGALDRFGLGAEELVIRRAGLVVVELSAWGHTGPWAGRRGFDSVVQAPTGIADIEGRDGHPGALPCQLLDHGTGYLAAAAALDGLRRQERHGGAYLRRLSLARTAGWLVTNGDGRGAPEDTVGVSPWISVLDAGPDAVEAVSPPGALGGIPLTWNGPPSRYLADRPAWSTAPKP